MGADPGQCLERGSEGPARESMEVIGKERGHGCQLPGVFPLSFTVSEKGSQLDQ